VYAIFFDSSRFHDMAGSSFLTHAANVNVLALKTSSLGTTT